MADESVPVPANWAGHALYDAARYRADHAASLADPDGFWRGQVDRLNWHLPPTRMDESSFAEADFGIRWFADGRLNVAENCIDRHLWERADQTAIIWEPDDPAEEPLFDGH